MSGLPSSDDGRWRCAGGLAAVLRDARHRARLSQRELAARAGLSRGTVAAAELGEDPRRSTLVRLLQVLPGLDARAILHGPDAVPLAASPAIWELQRAVSGFGARRAELRLLSGSSSTRLLMVVDGVRPLSADPRDPGVLRALVHAVHRGDPRRLAGALPTRLGPGETRVEILEGTVEHVLTFPEDLEAEGFRYERASSPRSSLLETSREGTLMHAPGFPVDELQLSAELPGCSPAPRPRVEVRAVGLGGIDAARRLASPDALASWDAEREEVAAWVRRPLLHLAHELRWDSESEGPEARGAGLVALARAAGGERPGETTAFPTVLRRARNEAGLSQRGLASLMRTGVATVAGAERGVDVRLSTLRSVVSALPSLSPEDVLGASRVVDPDRLPTRHEAWEWTRRAHGVVAEEELKRVEVGEDGCAFATYLTRGLHRIDEVDEELVVRYGSSPAGGDAAPPDRIEPVGDLDADELRTRLLHLASGRLVHELRFSAAAARRGVSYLRRVPLGRAFATTAAAADGPLGPGVEGTTATAAFCVRRLAIEVIWPKRLRPRCVRAVALPPLLPFPGGSRGLVERLHPPGPEGLDLQHDRAGGVATLSVLEPLVGVRHALAWEVPD